MGLVEGIYEGIDDIVGIEEGFAVEVGIIVTVGLADREGEVEGLDDDEGSKEGSSLVDGENEGTIVGIEDTDILRVEFVGPDDDEEFNSCIGGVMDMSWELVRFDVSCAVVSGRAEFSSSDNMSSNISIELLLSAGIGVELEVKFWLLFKEGGDDC